MTLFDVEPEPVAGPTERVRLVVAYDGTGFHGFAPNAGVRTVGGTLAAALERILGRPVELTCAGRTDTGVHAWGQVVSFDGPADRIDPDELRAGLNGLCGPEIAVRGADLPGADFDARFSARARTYRYTVLNRPEPDPFLARTSWHVTAPLDLRRMQAACDPFIGEHDFSSFCRRPKRSESQGASLVRRVTDARWCDCGDGVLELWITANAFCHQMVRSVVGTLVDVGAGRLTAGEITAIIGAADRHAAGQLAPARGLCLWHVDYP